MLSKKDRKQVYRLSAKDQVSLFPPTERTILWIIAHNPETFTISFLLEVGNEVALSGAKPESNLAKAMAIAMSLQQRGMIKIETFETKITFKGQMYRLITHPSLIWWTLVAGILAICVAILLSLKPNTESKPEEKKSPPSTDSSLYHQVILKYPAKTK
jgi:hypothetical protein